MLHTVISSFRAATRATATARNTSTMVTTSPPSEQKAPVDVTITSDLICPWCWVGLRKLQDASKFTNIPIKVTWKPYMLRPNTPIEGTPKDGPTPQSRVGTHLRHAGESVGINFTGLTDRTPNTILFHATMKYLQDELKNVDANNNALANAFQEEAFNGYFTLGEFPDQDGLLKAAKRVGNETLYEKVKALYDGDKEATLLDKLRKEVVEEAMVASRMGISGVPSFTFGNERRPAFSGAQSTNVFAQYLNEYY